MNNRAIWGWARQEATANQCLGTSAAVRAKVGGFFTDLTHRAAEARRIVKRLEFHHTPKHASWLNTAEIEFSVLGRACLKGRNPDADALQRAITAYETRRNAARIPISWRFGTDNARIKLQRFYPCLSNVD